VKTSLRLLILVVSVAVVVVTSASGGAASAAPVPPAPAPPPPAEAPSMGPPSEALPPMPPAAVAPDSPRGGKSPLIALALAVGVPALGLAIGVPIADGEADLGGGTTLAALSAIVGPSVGWFYAGRPWYGLATTGGRLAGGVLLLWAVADSFEARATSSDEARALAGVGLIIGSTLVDLIGPPAVIGRDNDRAGAVVVVPTAHPGGGGLAVAGSF
jgi:hypothetical protein